LVAFRREPVPAEVPGEGDAGALQAVEPFLDLLHHAYEAEPLTEF
jgi:hypothetical protein